MPKAGAMRRPDPEAAIRGRVPAPESCALPDPRDPPGSSEVRETPRSPQGLAWFAELLEELDRSNAQTHKLEVLRTRLAILGDPAIGMRGPSALHHDLGWVVYFLCGGKLARAIRSTTLREAALRASGLAPWLFEACYAHAGDLAETIACCLQASPVAWAGAPCALTTEQPDARQAMPQAGSLHAWLHAEVMPAAESPVEQQIAWLIKHWSMQSRSERFAMNKLLTGGFRLGVSRALVLRAMAQAAGCDERDLAQRFMGWMEQLPDGARLLGLFNTTADVVSARPLPFCLANAYEGDPDPMGALSDWQLEWKWDGIRVQWIKSGKAVYLWSRGEELISEQFPDLALSQAHEAIADQTVLDGELVAWDPASRRPGSFASLQKRMHRKRLNARFIAEHPVRLLVYDVLTLAGEDLRARPLHERRGKLEALGATLGELVQLSPVLHAETWEAASILRDTARSVDAEGLMLKHRESGYRAGRGKCFREDGKRSGWWKWKLDPLRIDAVLVYAQAGHGRRANLFSDYTFAVRGPEGWLTVAKAYSGLSDAEIREVDARIRKTTLDQYGPVRAVEPSMVFELGFEAIHVSNRHRAGLALRFPRMLRWRKDKSIDQADRIEDLRALMQHSGHAAS